MCVCVCGAVLLTPPSHGVFATRHDVFALLVLARDHLKLDAGVAHPMVSAGTRATGVTTEFTMMWYRIWVYYEFTMIDVLYHGKSHGFPEGICDPCHVSYLLRHSCRI